MAKEKQTDMINEEISFSRPLVHRSKGSRINTDVIGNPSSSENKI
jgi:hypothetical protein